MAELTTMQTSKPYAGRAMAKKLGPSSKNERTNARYLNAMPFMFLACAARTPIRTKDNRSARNADARLRQASADHCLSYVCHAVDSQEDLPPILLCASGADVLCGSKACAGFVRKHAQGNIRDTGIHVSIAGICFGQSRQTCETEDRIARMLAGPLLGGN
jgi:hypothetical protein